MDSNLISLDRRRLSWNQISLKRRGMFRNRISLDRRRMRWNQISLRRMGMDRNRLPLVRRRMDRKEPLDRRRICLEPNILEKKEDRSDSEPHTLGKEGDELEVNRLSFTQINIRNAYYQVGFCTEDISTLTIQVL